ncbi:MAG: hypothetical protein ACTSU2_06110 [Promethearchaeota archaeon]
MDLMEAPGGVELKDFLKEIIYFLRNFEYKIKQTKKKYYFVPLKYLSKRLNKPYDAIATIIESFFSDSIRILDAGNKEDRALIRQVETNYLNFLGNLRDLADFFNDEGGFHDYENDLNNREGNDLRSAYDLYLQKQNKFNRMVTNNEGQTKGGLDLNFSSNKSKRKKEAFILNISLIKDDFQYGLVEVYNVAAFIRSALKFIPIDDLIAIFSWKNFEEFIALVFEEFGFYSTNNFRFSIKNTKYQNKDLIILSRNTNKPKKRFEIDIIGIKKDVVLFADAKFWKRNNPSFSSLILVVKDQIARAKIFSINPDAVNKLFLKFSVNLRNRLIKNLKGRKAATMNNKLRVRKKSSSTSSKRFNHQKNSGTNSDYDYQFKTQYFRFPLKIYPIIITLNCPKNVINEIYNTYLTPIVNIESLPAFLEDFFINQKKYLNILISKTNIQDLLKN